MTGEAILKVRHYLSRSKRNWIDKKETIPLSFRGMDIRKELVCKEREGTLLIKTEKEGEIDREK